MATITNYINLSTNIPAVAQSAANGMQQLANGANNATGKMQQFINATNSAKAVGVDSLHRLRAISLQTWPCGVLAWSQAQLQD